MVRSKIKRVILSGRVERWFAPLEKVEMTTLNFIYNICFYKFNQYKADSM